MNKDFIIENGILKKYVGDNKNVIIPENVTSIGDNAFRDCTSLKSVIIPDSVTSIGDGAFCFCFSMQSVTIGKSVTNIGNCAFVGCTSLINIKIPDGVKSIGNCAFYNCRNLKSIKHNYKAFTVNGNGNLYSVQNSMQYKLGRTEKLDGEIKICKRGFHFCTNIFDIFNHYHGEYGKDFIICLCDVNEANIQTHSEDSKCCTDILTPIRILTRKEVIDLMNGKDIFEN